MANKKSNIDNLLNFNYKLKNIIDIKIEKGIPHNKPADLYMAYVLGKAYKTHSAILILCKNGFGEDAFMLERTLFELMVSCKYILIDNTGKRLERFMDHDWVIRKKMFNYILSNDILLKKINKKIIKDIEDNYTRVNVKWRYRNNDWSDKGIDKMAEEIGRLDAYRTVYKLQCTLGHSNSRSMNEYTKEENGDIIIGIEGGDNLIVETLTSLFDFQSYILKEACDLYNWQKVDIEKLIGEFVDYNKKKI